MSITGKLTRQCIDNPQYYPFMSARVANTAQPRTQRRNAKRSTEAICARRNSGARIFIACPSLDLQNQDVALSANRLGAVRLQNGQVRDAFALEITPKMQCVLNYIRACHRVRIYSQQSRARKNDAQSGTSKVSRKMKFQAKKRPTNPNCGDKEAFMLLFMPPLSQLFIELTLDIP